MNIDTAGRTYTLTTDETDRSYDYAIPAGWGLYDGYLVARAIHDDRRPGTEVIDWRVNRVTA